MRHLDVLIAAPSDPAGLPAWGDYHFARGLQAALHRAGVRSRLLFRDTYEAAPPPPGGGDLLVIRGKFAPALSWLERAGYGSRMLWQISWPLDPTPEEWQGYDRIAVASAQDLPRIARLSGRPCLLLLQATAFAGLRRPSARPAGQLLFVGSTRGLPRPIVADFAAARLPLQLIGQGWERFGLAAAAPSIANAALPELYSGAFAVLNDHHSAMAAYGYLNNRCFDVLACGVPLITDVAPGCPAELAAGVIRHRPGIDPPQRSLERALSLQAQPELLMELARQTRRHHSFEARVAQLLGPSGAGVVRP